MIGRRSFLAGILGAAAAPAIVKAESLMKIVVPRARLYTGEIGVIDGFLVVVSPTMSTSYAAREMLRIAQRDLLSMYSREVSLPSSSGKTIKFRRYGNGAVFAPSTPLHDLLHGDRKTA